MENIFVILNAKSKSGGSLFISDINWQSKKKKKKKSKMKNYKKGSRTDNLILLLASKAVAVPILLGTFKNRIANNML